MELLDQAKSDELRETLMTRKHTDTIEKRLEELRAASVITIAPRVQDLLDKEK
jgi:hypothetical protein